MTLCQQSLVKKVGSIVFISTVTLNHSLSTDDCISPGYHTSLPLEVHGSSYSEMEMISRISFQKLNRPAVCVTQHSFDLETFTYFVVSILCQQNNKAYDVFYDWAFEIINVSGL